MYCKNSVNQKCVVLELYIFDYTTFQTQIRAHNNFINMLSTS